MIKSYKFRIYPNKQQTEMLNKHFGCTRFIYNWALDYSKNQYKLNKKSFSRFNIQSQLPTLKQQAETQWLKEVNSQSLQCAIKNLDSSFKRFFKKQSKFPTFHKKRNKQSFQIPQNVIIDLEKSTVSIPKVDGEIDVVFHRKIDGTIRSATISKTPSDKYFISLCVENDSTIPNKYSLNKDKAVGIDLGIKDFAMLSNGIKIPNPNINKNYEDRKAVLQNRAANKELGSRNRYKANLKVNKIYEKINNKKSDFLHQLSSKLIRENQTICLEDLNVSGMMKNHKLAKAIQSCSWSEFVRQLTYKAEWYGNNIIRINRFSPSSKMCSNCGCIKDDLRLVDRNWKCSHCECEHDRDVNAAKNILDFAFDNTGREPPVELTEKLTAVVFRKKNYKSVR
jgi:putative transposase